MGKIVKTGKKTWRIQNEANKTLGKSFNNRTKAKKHLKKVARQARIRK